MKNLIFSFLSSGKDPAVLLMAASIRKYAGNLSNSPIWMLIPKPKVELADEIKEQLQIYNVDVIPFEIDPEILKFPFAGYVYAAGNC